MHQNQTIKKCFLVSCEEKVQQPLSVDTLSVTSAASKNLATLENLRFLISADMFPLLAG